MTITGCKIHPAIGVARVGDSPDGDFVGPERPGAPALPDDGKYKDASGRVKRQAARFRVFGYDEHGDARELTAADADITWTVHLVNRKAAAPRLRPGPDGQRIRNGHVEGDDRAALAIDPGPRSISGRRKGKGKPRSRFTAGVFGVADVPEVAIELGELRTDDAGRLLVLGGRGRAVSPGRREMTDFADNDGWCDDTSDGWVRASVRLPGVDEPIEATPAWVVVAPPDFAPSIGNVVTLLDVVEQAVAERRSEPAPDWVDFEADIRPLLKRVIAHQWVHETAFRGHRRGDQDPTDTTAVERRGDFSDEALLAQLADPSKAAKAVREAVLDHIRDPRPPDPADKAALDRARRQATGRYMPPMSGDGGRRRDGDPARWLSVTRLQYRRLEVWAEGRFAPPGPPVAAPGSAGPSPSDLDRAALENCSGGAFFPGIEVSGLIRDPERYLRPAEPGDRYRLDPAGLEAGALTAPMAVPWQADFALCRGFWWPAQRPNDVVTEHDYDAVREGRPEERRPGPLLDTLALPRKAWDRGVGDRPLTWSGDANLRRQNDMVARWSKLGFVVPRVGDAGDPPVWVEAEREPYFGLRDRDYFHILLNRADHPRFEPVAWALANWFFDDAQRRIETDDTLDSELHPFEYDEIDFETRLGSIYRFLADQVEAYDPREDATYSSREHVIERIRQFGPINLTDGEWLRGIDTVPPRPGVTDQLGTIRADEKGNGVEQHDHAHIYAALMSGVGLAFAPVDSREYAEDPELLDSAFTLPVLALAAAEFSQAFLPEILGMTLYFEWESVWLRYVVKLFDHFGIDPTFYVAHLAIDNVAEGHGAMAVRAVKTYLAAFEGEERQEQWRRVWRGYVAFRETGTLGSDLKDKVQPDRVDLHTRMVRMIERKKPFGSLNHGGAALMKNDMFDDPEGLLRYLADNTALVTPGRPDRSGLVDLFAVDNKMYKVFSPEEQQLWADWIRSLPAPPPAAVPAGQPGHFRRLTSASPAAAFAADPRGLRGAGGLQ